MPLNFYCPFCGQMLSVPDESAGASGACLYCQATIQAPSSSEEAAQLIAPPVHPPSHNTTSRGPGPLRAGDVLAEAFDRIRAHWPLMLGASLFAWIVPGIAAFVLQLLIFGPGQFMEESAEPGTVQMVLFMVVVFALMITTIPLYAGLYYIHEAILLNRPAAFNLLFRGFRKAGQFIAVYFLTGLAVMPVLALMFLIVMAFAGWDVSQWDMDAWEESPSFFWNLFAVYSLFGLLSGFIVAQLQFATPEIVDRKTSTLEAMRISWQITKRRRWHVVGISLLLYLLLIPAYLIGLAMLCLGVYITVPLAFSMMMMGQMIMYRQIRGLQGEGE